MSCSALKWARAGARRGGWRRASARLVIQRADGRPIGDLWGIAESTAREVVELADQPRPDLHLLGIEHRFDLLAGLELQLLKLIIQARVVVVSA